MASQDTSGGEPGARVVNNIDHVAGSFNQYNAPVTQSGNDDVRKLVEDHITELRYAIVAAEQRNELSSADSKAALVQLDGATAKVRASGRDRKRLAETLHQIHDALSGGLSIVAQLAAVIAAVKGL